jgi:hypothetical protein
MAETASFFDGKKSTRRGPVVTPRRESRVAVTPVPETRVEKMPSPVSQTENGSSGWEKKNVRQAAIMA